MSRRKRQSASQLGFNQGGGTQISDEMMQSMLGIIPQSDGTFDLTADETGREIRVGNFCLSPVGLQIDGEVSETEWLDFFKVLQRIQSSMQWIIGDWLAYGEHTWGKTYEEMSALTGYRVQTLRDYAYVSRNINLSIRIDTLSFAHHQLVAPMNPEDQRNWLEAAEQNGWSVRQMRTAMGEQEDRATLTPRQQAKKASKTASQLFEIAFSDRVRISSKKREQRLQELEALRRLLDEAERKLRDE